MRASREFIKRLGVFVVGWAWAASAWSGPDGARPAHDPKQVAAARDPAANPPTVADLLPKPARLTRDDCMRLNQAKEPYYEGLFQRGLSGMRNPSAREAYAPPAWTPLMDDPDFNRWLDRHVDDTCYRVVKIDAWLSAIGSAFDVDNRLAARDTRMVLGEARAAARASGR